MAGGVAVRLGDAELSFEPLDPLLQLAALDGDPDLAQDARGGGRVGRWKMVGKVVGGGGDAARSMAPSVPALVPALPDQYENSRSGRSRSASKPSLMEATSMQKVRRLGACRAPGGALCPVIWKTFHVRRFHLAAGA